MLGTNDLKERFDQLPEQIAANVEALVKMIQKRAVDKSNKSSKIILLSPPLVDESVPTKELSYKGAEEKSKKLAPLYEVVAQKYGCEFIDIAQVVSPSKVDGLHLDPKAHQSIAKELVKYLIK